MSVYIEVQTAINQRRIEEMIEEQKNNTTEAKNSPANTTNLKLNANINLL